MLCGINIVLLRGLGREAGHWLGFDQQLTVACQARMPTLDFRIVTPDIPGCGSACQESTPLDLKAITNQTSEWLPEAASGTWNIVVGLSMGGMIALDLAQRFQERVHGVVLINSSSAEQRPWQRITPRGMLYSFVSLLVPWQQREALMLRLVSNRNRAASLPQWLQIQAQRPVTKWNLLKMVLAASRFHLPAVVPQRGLVITSEADRMVAPACSAALARQLQWPLLRHPSAGHDLPLDDPRWLASSISEWLATELDAEFTAPREAGVGAT